MKQRPRQRKPASSGKGNTMPSTFTKFSQTGIRKEFDVTPKDSQRPVILEYYSEVSKVFQALPENKSNVSRIRSFENRSDGVQWFGACTNWKDTVELVRGGWRDGVEKGTIFEKKNKIPSLSLPSSRRKKAFGEQGMRLDLIRATQGRLDPWKKMIKVESDKFARKGLVTVAIRIDGNCNVKADELFWRGMTGLHIAESFMKAGKKVRILAVIATENRSHQENLIGVVKIKDYGEVVDRARLFSHICLSGFFRTVGFRMILNTDFDVGAGLGHTWVLSEERLQKMLEPVSDSSPMVIVDGALNLSGAEETVNRLSDAIKKARETK